MHSAIQASSSRSNATVAIAIDALKTPQMPLAGSSHGPIACEQITKNTSESRSSNEALSELDTNAFRKNAKSALQESTPSRSSQSEGGHTAALQSSYILLARITQEIQELVELDSRQGEEIKALSEQLFAAAWQASISTPRNIQDRYLGNMTDLLGEGVGRLVSLDGKFLRQNGKLPERSPLWDFGNLVPGPVLPRAPSRSGGARKSLRLRLPPTLGTQRTRPTSLLTPVVPSSVAGSRQSKCSIHGR
ncbi:hypothetical protein NLJ89_g11654 [Agrocybe chaxingu]|uniref:Uncharacterized protein n=1 Tax=Agrocybe chaxingu TaxID=84603 RepID=A0A9W8JPK5_9AGAR|nr:hypothetical protein NLJ89_g11654 [Agrocybe chaxingu]